MDSNQAVTAVANLKPTEEQLLSDHHYVHHHGPEKFTIQQTLRCLTIKQLDLIVNSYNSINKCYSKWVLEEAEILRNDTKSNIVLF